MLDRLPSGSRVAYCAPEAHSDLPAGVEWLAIDAANPAALLRQLGGQTAGSILLLRSDTRLPMLTVERLHKALGEDPAAVVVSPLGNTEQRLWPLPWVGPGSNASDVDRTALATAEGLDGEALDRWLFGLSQRQVFATSVIHSGCSLWRSAALPERELQASTNLAELANNLVACGERLLAVDHVYVAQAEARPQAALDRSPDPLEPLRVKLRDALLEPTSPPPAAGLTERAVQLHILHSWGGGVAQWVDDIVASQRDRDHLRLIAQGQSGQACGQELQLWADAATPLEVFPLSQPIASTALAHAEYREILGQIIERYGVTQLAVSSLVGHALDCLDCGLPTELVLHDFYPCWPLLDIAFETTPAELLQLDRLQDQLDAGADRLFGDKAARHWQQLRDRYLELINADDIVPVAPSQSVVDGLVQLDPRFADVAIQVIGHGLADWPAHDYRYQLAPELNTGPAPRRLRLVVPGRISTAKGKQLLLEALPQLRELADIYLVGAGQDGEDFFGLSGVHVVMQYARDELPMLLKQLRPDAALLLSMVSETFSYTLSELQSLGVPVVATAVGSLRERLESAQQIEPDAAALIDAVQQLRAKPASLAAWAAPSIRSLAEMASEHSRVFPARAGTALRYRLQTPTMDSASKAKQARQLDRLRKLTRQQQEQLSNAQQELQRRSEWGYGLQRKLRERTDWAKSLEADLLANRQARQQLQQDFDQRTDWALRLDGELNQLRESRSWQLTRPLRGGARYARALLQRFGFQRQRVKTLAKRTHNSLQVRGLRGTLDRIGRELKPPSPRPTQFVVPQVSELKPEQPLIFTAVDRPTASIVIPVYNQFEHTWGCLRSLLDAVNQTSFEVIVIDDASSDQTQQRLQRCSGLRYLRNEQNLGFVGSCNRAAEQATGEFVVLLNNDTAVGDGWLDALLTIFSAQPDAGLVGAKLVYPDGTLQEAGGIVFSDGSGWNYGRNEDPADPAYNFVREVDYCSGACVALRRELWQQLGGFDARYAPAYYEDTDLAMQVRAAGLKVYYQPAAVVTHFEGVTSGTDTASGTKRYQIINQSKFVEKWREQLSASHPASGSSIRVARDHRHPKQALVVDACTPTPDQDSGSVRMTNLMSLLRELGYQVAFLADNRAYVEGYTEQLQQLGVEVHYQPYVPSPEQLLKQIGAELDLVILSRHYVAGRYVDSVRWHCQRAQLWFDTVDLHYLREQRLAQLDNDASLATIAVQTRRDELGVARRCDLTLVVSHHEQQVLASDAPDLEVAVLSNIHPVMGCRRPFEARRDLFFVGGFQHPPNIDAAHWFVSEVWPLIRAELPELQFYLIGSRAPKQVARLGLHEGVVFKGFVPDLEPYLDGCRLAVAPLRYGAGVKGKVNMSMSYGQPVIATPPAVEGMFVSAEQEVLIAADAAGFASAVVRAYQDRGLWNQLSANGLTNVERYFSFAAARQALQEALGRGT